MFRTILVLMILKWTRRRVHRCMDTRMIPHLSLLSSKESKNAHHKHADKILLKNSFVLSSYINLSWLILSFWHVLQISKQQLQTIKDRFQAFLNGETQIVADEAFINAVQSYYEVRRDDFTMHVNHWSRLYPQTGSNVELMDSLSTKHKQKASARLLLFDVWYITRFVRLTIWRCVIHKATVATPFSVL